MSGPHISTGRSRSRKALRPKSKPILPRKILEILGVKFTRVGKQRDKMAGTGEPHFKGAPHLDNRVGRLIQSQPCDTWNGDLSSCGLSMLTHFPRLDPLLIGCGGSGLKGCCSS